MFSRRERVIENDESIVIGARRVPFLRDVYHVFLRVTWPRALGGVVGVFLLLNVLFGAVFLLVGGVANARPGSFFDAFVFSVQTMATIGYGNMSPETVPAHLLVVSEAVCGLLFTAVTTGLVFAKFTLSPAMIAFARHVAISPMNGAPTMAIRLGNERGNFIVEATVRVSLVRTEHTAEGVLWYRMIDLPLVRERTPAMTRSWSVLHVIDEKSPLWGATPESIAKDEVEVIVSIMGLDDTSMQPVHARKRYFDKDILFGMRHADMVSLASDNQRLVVDVHKFHDVVPTAPTAAFPFPRSASLPVLTSAQDVDRPISA